MYDFHILIYLLIANMYNKLLFDIVHMKIYIFSIYNQIFNYNLINYFLLT
jgi:hypothetical protein